MSQPAPMDGPPLYGDESELRRRAEERLAAKRGLVAHLLAYVMVNGFLVAIWFATSRDGFFWPMFPILGWGIGVVFNVWDVFSPSPSEERIRAEMDRLRRP